MKPTRYAALLIGPVLVLFAIPAFYPLLNDGLTASFDGRTHLLRLAALANAVAEGIYLPRWLPAMQLGYGYPVFNFYPPGAYYLALLPSLFGVSLYWSYAFGFVLAILLAGIGATLFAYDLLRGYAAHGTQQRVPTVAVWGALAPALLVGVAYMYAPYLLVNVYIRGSLPEAVAQALLPWILWSSRRLLSQARPTGYVLFCAIFLAGLALTHSLTLLLTIPYLLVYLWVIWWNSGRSMVPLRWIVVSLLLAAGVSAFFWLPMVVDRRYLSQAGYAMARDGWLPGNVWQWSTFLDRQFSYGYDFSRPVQLGLVQLIVGGGGFLWTRRRGEWLFFALAALLAMVCIGAWSLPIWQRSDILAAVQFPWRLLSLVSLSLAILSAGWLLRLPAGWPPWVGALLLSLVLIAAQRPQLGAIDYYPPASVRLDEPLLAQAEVEKGVLTDDPASSVQEFRPEWAVDDLILDAMPNEPPTVRMSTLQASPLAFAMRVNVPVTTTLRFQDFYFPGWQVLGPDNQPLKPYPSTDLGLLTVDLPRGIYTLTKEWREPPLAYDGAAISVMTLALLVLLCLADWRYRWFGVLPAFLLLVVVTVGGQTPALTAVQSPSASVAGFGLRLLGFRVETVKTGEMLLHSYWYVVDSPPADLQFRWQLRYPTGTIVQDYTSRPYFNTMSAANWPPGTVVDDAVQLVLPDSEVDGTYQLAVGFVVSDPTADPTADTPVSPVPPVVIGRVNATNGADTPPQPQQLVMAALGSSIQLLGADYAVDKAWLSAAGTRPLQVTPGQMLAVRLYWRTRAALTADLHGFVHLVDAQGRVIAQQDQVPGLDFQPSTLWLPGNTVLDEYRLWIPSDTQSTVLWPRVGLYNVTTGDRLLSQGADGATMDALELAPIKVIRKTKPAAMQPVDLRFGDVAALIGYAVDAPTQGLHPGDTVRVRLAWQSRVPTATNLTRFVHLYSPTLGMAGQADGIPQAGNNPTWSWTLDEVIIDELVVPILAEATPGEYTFYVGFYDAQADGQRLPVTDQGGNGLPDSLAPLTTLVLQ